MSLSARLPPITTYIKTTIFTSWSLSVPIVGAVRGEDVVRSILFGYWMTHFSATPAMAGSSDTICFGSLEFPALSPIGMQVPPVFEPFQAFCFGSLDFIDSSRKLASTCVINFIIILCLILLIGILRFDVIGLNFCPRETNAAQFRHGPIKIGPY